MGAIRFIKRALWVLMLFLGMLILAGLAVGLPFGRYQARENLLVVRLLIVPVTGLSVIFFMGAGACAAGLFMRPRAFIEATKPNEAEVIPLAWVRELRARIGGQSKLAECVLIPYTPIEIRALRRRGLELGGYFGRHVVVDVLLAASEGHGERAIGGVVQHTCDCR